MEAEMDTEETAARALLEERGFKKFTLAPNPAASFAGLRWKCVIKGVRLLAPGKPEGYGSTPMQAVKNALGTNPVLKGDDEEE